MSVNEKSVNPYFFHEKGQTALSTMKPFEVWTSFEWDRVVGDNIVDTPTPRGAQCVVRQYYITATLRRVDLRWNSV
jgi:hypothetical protein